MKRKTKQKSERETKRTETPVKGDLQALTEYFGSYLSALEVVSARQ